MSAVRTTRTSKHGNIPTTVDGIRFHSQKEAKRYSELKILERAGEISHLTAQKKDLRHPIEIRGVHICYYEADFHYLAKNGDRIIEDCKGYRTAVYKLKKKLMKAVYGIDIFES